MSYRVYCNGMMFPQYAILQYKHMCVYFPFLDRVLTLSPRPSLPAAFASLCPYHLRSQPSTWTGWGECTDADQVEMVKYAYVDVGAQSEGALQAYDR